MRKTTRDQQIYNVDGRWKAKIDIDLEQEDSQAPSIESCRHAVLTIQAKDVHGNNVPGYVVYDRLLCRIVNGVFYDGPEDVLQVAQRYNDDPDSPQDMAPNGLALGLVYPPQE